MTEPATFATPTRERTGTPLLSVRDLSVTFPQRDGDDVHAVRGVSYDVYPGEFLGIVGESVSSLAIMGLLPSTAEITGSIEFEGRPLIGLDDAKLSRIRGKELAMVFQDPLSALTPVYTVGDQISEALRLHDSLLSCRPPPPAPSSCSRSSASPTPSGAPARSRTSTPAACVSAR